MPDDDWNPITNEQLRKIRHMDGVVARITADAQRLCDLANSMAPTDAKGENFKVTVQNDSSTQRPRAYVRPVGKTGLVIEQGESALLKSIASMGSS